MSEDPNQERFTRTVSPPMHPIERTTSVELSTTRKNFHERNLEHLKTLTTQNSKKLSDLQEEKKKLEIARQRLAQKVLKRNAESKIKQTIQEEKVEEDKQESLKLDQKRRNMDYIQSLQESNKAKQLLRQEQEEKKLKEKKKLRDSLGLSDVKSKVSEFEERKAAKRVEEKKVRVREDFVKGKKEEIEEKRGKKEDVEDRKDEKKGKKSDELSFQRLTQMPKRFSGVPVVTDMGIFKKKNGLGEKDKVFIINGCYPDIRKALLKRNWFENTDKDSNCYDLKWTLRRKDVDFNSMQDTQICNHFEKSTNLTTKVGLCKNLKNLIWFNNVDIDTFYPRCFDVSEQSDYEEFIIYFKLIKAESVLKQFISGCNVPVPRVEVAFNVCQRRLRNLDDIIDDPNTRWEMVTDKEWEILNEDSMSLEDLKKIKHENWISKLDKEFNQKPKKKKKKSQNNEKKNDSAPEMEETELVFKVRKLLEEVKNKFPQYDLNGKTNIWIVKPAGLSRGRGIRCHNSLIEIQDHIQKEGTWVVQKYIENPLLILKKKFDIRQWVLVTCWNPLTVWFYERSYLRFGVEDFSIDNLKNRYIHLTNNSVAKNAENFENTEIEGSMWHSEEFGEWMNEECGKDLYEEEIKPKIKNIVLYTLECVQDMVENTKCAAELYGYDIMLDQDYKPWLIEINSSPAMDYSTPVTKELVKQVLEDTVKVIVDYHYASKKRKKKIDTGNFSLLYKAKNIVDRPLQAVGLNLICEGKSMK